MLSSKWLHAVCYLKRSTAPFYAVNKLNVISSRSWRGVELFLIILP